MELRAELLVGRAGRFQKPPWSSDLTSGGESLLRHLQEVEPSLPLPGTLVSPLLFPAGCTWDRADAQGDMQMPAPNTITEQRGMASHLR